MLRIVLILSIFLSARSLSSQSKLEFEAKKLYLGDVELTNEIAVEFKFINNSNEKARLSFEPITGLVSMVFEKKEYLPNEKGSLRMNFYPETEGAFLEKIYLVVDDKEKIELIIYGNVTNHTKQYQSLQEDYKLSGEKDVIFSVVNGETMKGIPYAKIFIRNVENGKSYIGTSDHFGVLINRIPEGKYKVQSLIEGYKNDAIDIKLDPNRNIAMVLLEKNDSKDTFRKRIEPKITKKDTIVKPLEIQKEVAEEKFEPEIEPKVDEKLIVAPIETEKFQANGTRKVLNIILLIDVSKSMELANRIETLKKTIINLVQNYQSNDQLAILTFNDQVNTLIERGKVLDKNATILKIKSIQPSGTTDGVLGIDVAFDILQNNMESNAINMVIIATDGKISNNSYDDKKMFEKIERMNEKGILTSVVGFGTKGYENTKLNKMSAIGGGLFIDLSSNFENQESVLLDEIYMTLLKVNR